MTVRRHKKRATLANSLYLGYRDTLTREQVALRITRLVTLAISRAITYLAGTAHLRTVAEASQISYPLLLTRTLSPTKKTT